MKITRMTAEGAKGWANIARREVAGKAVIGIRGNGAAGIFDLSVNTRDKRSQQYAAARLQRELDGYLTKVREQSDPEKIRALRRRPPPKECEPDAGTKRFLVTFRVDRVRPLVGDGGTAT